jgi:small subunit ribosomal protein S11
MGKKHVIETNQEDLIKQKEQVDKTVNKEVRVKSSERVSEGRVYISSSYNNTIVTLTNARGQVLASKSAGAVGFKGAKKATSFAASRVAEAIVNICKKLMVEKLEVFI